jgi:hypothetical protein
MNQNLLTLKIYWLLHIFDICMIGMQILNFKNHHFICFKYGFYQRKCLGTCVHFFGYIMHSEISIFAPRGDVLTHVLKFDGTPWLALLP